MYNNIERDIWNAKYPVGTEVKFWVVPDGPKYYGITVSQAFVISQHCPVILLKGYCGIILLEQVEPLEEILFNER